MASQPPPSAGPEDFIPYGRQQIEDEDIRAVIDVLRSDWLTTGPKVEAFEEGIAAEVGAKYAVSFSSGTAALHGAAHAAGLGPGDEAITTPLTFCATANCVLYCGATPVFADVRDDTLTLDPGEVKKKIAPRTRAVLPVDYAGHPADLDEIMALADRHGLTVIEDACHALGALYRDRPVGSIAHLTVFSFHPVKHLACGEGGMVTTDDPRLAEKLRLFRNHGMTRGARERQDSETWTYDIETLGFNYRLSDIASALGLSQLSRLDANLAGRRRVVDQYREEFEGLSGIRLPIESERVRSAWHLFPIRLDTQHGISRDEIFSAMRARNIGVNVHYIPIHLFSYYRNRYGYRVGDYPVAEAAYRDMISIPLFPALTEAETSRISQRLRTAIGNTVTTRQTHVQGRIP